MISRTIRARLGLASVAAALFFPHAGVRADEAPAGALAFTVEVPLGKLSTREVHDVVAAASTGRGWAVKEDGTEKLVIYINKHRHEATVTYVISDKQVQAYCEGYATDGSGTRKGPEQPTGWLRNLDGDITKGMKKAASDDQK